MLTNLFRYKLTYIHQVFLPSFLPTPNQYLIPLSPPITYRQLPINQKPIADHPIVGLQWPTYYDIPFRSPPPPPPFFFFFFFLFLSFSFFFSLLSRSSPCAFSSFLLLCLPTSALLSSLSSPRVSLRPSCYLPILFIYFIHLFVLFDFYFFMFSCFYTVHFLSTIFQEPLLGTQMHALILSRPSLIYPFILFSLV